MLCSWENVSLDNPEQLLQLDGFIRREDANPMTLGFRLHTAGLQLLCDDLLCTRWTVVKGHANVRVSSSSVCVGVGWERGGCVVWILFRGIIAAALCEWPWLLTEVALCCVCNARVEPWRLTCLGKTLGHEVGGPPDDHRGWVTLGSSININSLM